MAILEGLSEFRTADPVRGPELPARKPPIPVPELDLGLAAPPQQHSGRAHAMKKSRRREHLISGATWVRNIGALLILFAAWQLWGTAIAQHHSQASLKQEFAAKVHGKPHTKGFSLISVSAKVPEPPDGTAMAEIQIPKIALNEYVVSGTDESDLAKGPGHYIGTAMPGQAGNVAIAGHRTTHGAPFNRLAELAPGDPIYLTDLSGQRLTYIVAQTPYPVSPSNTSVLQLLQRQSVDPDLQSGVLRRATADRGGRVPAPRREGTGASGRLSGRRHAVPGGRQRRGRMGHLPHSPGGGRGAAACCPRPDQ